MGPILHHFKPMSNLSQVSRPEVIDVIPRIEWIFIECVVGVFFEFHVKHILARFSDVG